MAHVSLNATTAPIPPARPALVSDPKRLLNVWSPNGPEATPLALVSVLPRKTPARPCSDNLSWIGHVPASESRIPFDRTPIFAFETDPPSGTTTSNLASPRSRKVPSTARFGENRHPSVIPKPVARRSLPEV